MRKNKSFFILFVLILFPVLVFSDTITMKDGKIKEGFIMFYSAGVYTVLVEGTRVEVKEEDVKSIEWKANVPQIRAAFAAEPKERREFGLFRIYPYVKSGVEMMFVLPGESSVYLGPVMFSTFLEAGVSNEFLYGGLNITLSGGSGKLPWHAEDASLSGEADYSLSITGIRAAIGLMFDMTDEPKIKIFLGPVFGFGLFKDVVNDYPVDSWPTVEYGDVTSDYVDIFMSFKAGVSFEPAERAIITIYTGVGGMRIQEYWDDLKGVTGILLGAEASYIF